MRYGELQAKLWTEMSVRYKGVLFGGDGSNYEGGSYGLTVLHCILQYYSAISNVMFDIQAYVDTAFVLKRLVMKSCSLHTLCRTPCLHF